MYNIYSLLLHRLYQSKLYIYIIYLFRFYCHLPLQALYIFVLFRLMALLGAETRSELQEVIILTYNRCVYSLPFMFN